MSSMGANGSRIWSCAAVLLSLAMTSCTGEPSNEDAADEGSKSEPSATADALVTEAVAGYASVVPGMDQPLARTVEGLRAAAAAGNANAACRLAAEYDGCAFVDGNLAKVELSIERRRLANDQPSSEEAVAFTKDAETSAMGKAAHCEGVTIPPSNVRIDHWRRAALSGNVAAMTAYSTGSVFQPRDVLETLDALKTYKAEAADMALRAARSGSPDAVLALANAYNPNERIGFGRSLLSQVVESDPKEALALYRLYRSSLVEHNPAYEQKLRRLDAKVALLEGQVPGSWVAEAKIEADTRRGTWKPLQFSDDHRVDVPPPTMARVSPSAFCDAK